MDESSFVDARHVRVSASYPWSVLCSTRHDAAKRDMQAMRGGSQSRTYTRPEGLAMSFGRGANPPGGIHDGLG